MKSIINYIKESLTFLENLKPDVQKFIKGVYETELKLIQNNKIEPIKFDVTKLNKPEHEFLYDEYYNDKQFKLIIDNKLFGFVVISQMLKQVKNYLIDEDKELKPDAYPYWYQGDKGIYCIGMLLYDKNIAYKENYLTLCAIETCLFALNSQDVNKAILNDFIKEVPKMGQYEGIAIKPLHPKMKASIQKLGFRPDTENKEILILKI
jgi:hypothetical protein